MSKDKLETPITKTKIDFFKQLCKFVYNLTRGIAIKSKKFHLKNKIL